MRLEVVLHRVRPMPWSRYRAVVYLRLGVMQAAGALDLVARVCVRHTGSLRAMRAAFHPAHCVPISLARHPEPAERTH